MNREFKCKHLPHNHDENTAKILKKEPTKESMEMSANIFAQLADPTRLKILWLLCHATECVQNIAAIMDMTSPAVSHHLSKLKSVGFIKSEKHGKEVYYSLENTEKAKLVHDIVDRVFDITHS